MFNWLKVLNWWCRNYFVCMLRDSLILYAQNGLKNMGIFTPTSRTKKDDSSEMRWFIQDRSSSHWDSFIFCPTLDVVLWWQAIGFQIFIVVSEMPSFLRVCGWVSDLPKKIWNLDIANCKRLTWVRKTGEDDPWVSQGTLSKATNIHARTWFSIGYSSVGCFWNDHY